MEKLKYFAMALLVAVSAGFVSCSDDDDEIELDAANKEHDSSLCREWVENDGSYVWDYYYFYSDGTGIEGSYEPDIDWVNEDYDITWYTENDEYIYIDGGRYRYWCDGATFDIEKNGRIKHYIEKD